MTDTGFDVLPLFRRHRPDGTPYLSAVTGTGAHVVLTKNPRHRRGSAEPEFYLRVEAPPETSTPKKSVTGAAWQGGAEQAPPHDTSAPAKGRATRIDPRWETPPEEQPC